MAKLDGKVSGFEKLEGEAYSALWKRHDKMVRDLAGRSASLDPDGPSLVGALIRFSVADGYALYVVSKDSPLTLRHVPYGDAYEAHPATVRGVTAETVRGELRQQRALAESADRSPSFYGKLQIGQIVHYHHFGRGFVRCEVVDGSGEERNQAGKCLKPVALVGEWNKRDLPRRDPDGRVSLGYSAELIVEGRLICPDSGCLYEGMSSENRRRYGDPSGLAPISLEVPPMTAAEEEQARLWSRVNRIRSFVNDPRVSDPAELLSEISRIVAAA